MKKASNHSDSFLDDFSAWLDSPEGEESMDVLDCVFNSLDGATVDPLKKRIIWPDGVSLSLDQSVERIMKDSGFKKQVILNHLIGWLQMEYIPEGLNEEQMEQFENQIERWVEKYEK